jgi:hypothetical protein
MDYGIKYRKHRFHSRPGTFKFGKKGDYNFSTVFAVDCTQKGTEILSIAFLHISTKLASMAKFNQVRLCPSHIYLWQRVMGLTKDCRRWTSSFIQRFLNMGTIATCLGRAIQMRILLFRSTLVIQAQNSPFLTQ